MNELQKSVSDDLAIAMTAENEDVLKGEAAAAELKLRKPVDYRYVPHGQGPCDCCGPYGE
jgi:hypothetical protein